MTPQIRAGQNVRERMERQESTASRVRHGVGIANEVRRNEMMKRRMQEIIGTTKMLRENQGYPLSARDNEDSVTNTGTTLCDNLS